MCIPRVKFSVFFAAPCMVDFVSYSRTDTIVIRTVFNPKIYFVTVHLVRMVVRRLLV